MILTALAAAAALQAADVNCPPDVITAQTWLAGQKAELVDQFEMQGEATFRLQTLRPRLLGLTALDAFVVMKPKDGFYPTFGSKVSSTPQTWIFVLPDSDFAKLAKRFIATYNPMFGRTDFNCYNRSCATGRSDAGPGRLESAELKFDQSKPGWRSWLPAKETLVLECTYSHS